MALESGAPKQEVEVTREYLTIDQCDETPNPGAALFVLLLPLVVYSTIESGHGWHVLRISFFAAVIAMLLAIPLYRFMFNGFPPRFVKPNGEPDQSGNVLFPCVFIGCAGVAAFVLSGIIACYCHWLATFYRGVY